MNFEYAYDNCGNIISEKRGELTTTYAYDALGQLIRVNDPHENATWVYNYDRGGNILSKVKYAYTEGELGTAVETIPYAYDDSNWKDKLTAYNGKTITYDAIGNPLNDGERQYEWEAGRRLKKLIVKGDPADGIENGFDEGSATSLKLEFSNGNLLANGVADTVITAKVYRKNVDVTDEYAATAFNWTRTSGNESADASWNAAHSGMKSITVSANELTDDIQIQCTLTGTSPAYGSVDVNDSFIASHTRGEADSNDTLSIEDGALFVTTDDDNYRLSGNELKALYPRLNGTVTTNAWVYHTQPLKTIEFKYNSSGLRVQKKVTANGKSETTDYTLHGKLVTHMTVGNNKLHFFYDAQSRPAKVNFNGTTYTYLHNLQGDIVGIIDNTGNLVVEYKYDAWGKPISITGVLAATLGKHNPFRYRGYVYDEESGLYYLRSRYYNPENGRFGNSDNWVSTRKALLWNNSYAYALNRPSVASDPSGHWTLEQKFLYLVTTADPKDKILQVRRKVASTLLGGDYPLWRSAESSNGAGGRKTIFSAHSSRQFFSFEAALATPFDLGESNAFMAVHGILRNIKDGIYWVDMNGYVEEAPDGSRGMRITMQVHKNTTIDYFGTGIYENSIIDSPVLTLIDLTDEEGVFWDGEREITILNEDQWIDDLLGKMELGMVE